MTHRQVYYTQSPPPPTTYAAVGPCLQATEPSPPDNRRPTGKFTTLSSILHQRHTPQSVHVPRPPSLHLLTTDDPQASLLPGFVANSKYKIEALFKDFQGPKLHFSSIKIIDKKPYPIRGHSKFRLQCGTETSKVKPNTDSKYW